MRILSLSTTLVFAIWIACVPALAAEEYVMLPDPIRAEPYKLASGGEAQRLQFLAAPKGQAGNSRSALLVTLIFDRSSNLAWWTWFGAFQLSAETFNAAWDYSFPRHWTVTSTAERNSLVGFYLNPATLLGVRSSSARASSPMEAQSLVLAELSRLDNPYLNPPGPSPERKPQTDPASYREIAYLQSILRCEILDLCGNHWDQTLRIRSVKQQPYGWDIEVQGTRSPRNKGTTEFGLVGVSKDFRLIAPHYAVVPESVQQAPLKLADGAEAISANFTVVSPPETAMPELNVRMVYAAASRRVWWIFGPPVSNVAIALGSEQRPLQDILLVLNEPKSLVGFLLGVNGNVTTRASTSTAESFADAQSVVLRELATGSPRGQGPEGLTEIDVLGFSFKLNPQPIMPFTARSIRRITAKPDGWVVDLVVKDGLVRINTSADFKVTGIEVLPAESR
jgi:hypothetical protein